MRIADRWITVFPLRVKRSHPNYPIARVRTFDPVSASGPTRSPDISFVTSPMLQKKIPEVLYSFKIDSNNNAILFENTPLLKALCIAQ